MEDVHPNREPTGNLPAHRELEFNSLHRDHELDLMTLG